MRLICPNCNAHYEIADDVIPPGGREVQCSSCSHSWFQEPGEATPPARKSAEADSDAARRPRLDKSIADILREEAGLQGKGPGEGTGTKAAAAAGTAAAAAAGSGSALRATPRRGEGDGARGLRGRLAAMQSEAEDDDALIDTPASAEDRPALRRTSPAARAAASRGAVEAPPSRRAQDIDSVNAKLRARAEEAQEVPHPSGLSKRRRGFRRGMSLVIIVLGLATGAYLFAVEIVAAVPESRPYMVQYVEAVDELREVTNAQLSEGLATATGFMVEQGWIEAPAPAAPAPAAEASAPAGDPAPEEAAEAEEPAPAPTVRTLATEAQEQQATGSGN